MKHYHRMIVMFILALLFAWTLSGCSSPATQAPEPTQAPAPTQPPAPTSTTAPVMDTATPVVVEDTGPWELIIKTTVEQPVRMAAFMDENFGVTGGADSTGQAYYTTDGGASWTRSTASSG